MGKFPQKRSSHNYGLWLSLSRKNRQESEYWWVRRYTTCSGRMHCALLSSGRRFRCLYSKTLPLCTHALEPHLVLGIPIGSPRSVIRERFYEMAKQTHPDVTQDGDAGRKSPSFIEVKAACDLMLAQTAHSPQRTSAKTAAKGWSRSRPASRAQA